MSVTSPTSARRARRRTAEGDPKRPRRVRRLSATDRFVVSLMVLIPTLLVVLLVWLPALSSVALSFTRWEGVGGLGTIEWIGVTNYENIFTIYPPFFPALQHNLIWLVFLFLVPTLFGILLAVLLDKELRGSRIYQTAFYLPVVLSLALTGFIWQLFYSRDQGLINAVTGLQIDWYGDPKYNLWAVLVATGWQHAGYIMLLYLAGLKSVDPSLREAASIDGSGEVSTFFRIIVPVMRPINLIVIVVTVINSLRAFDLVWVVNKGRNGLEIIAALVTQNVVGEASRIGFGSALATIMLLISSIFVVIYLNVVMKDDQVPAA
jgi:multiple sugar transport system permease protein